MSNAQLTPLVAGTLAILALAVHLVTRMPGPGPLAAPHASIGEEISGCVLCHTSDGLAAGCLDCHAEIAKELRARQGYHARLEHCKECHGEHQGRDFALTPRLTTFDHSHVAFRLNGAHANLACDKCHNRPFGARSRTYLGLTQACSSCHENIHKEGKFLDCAQCHDQATFEQPKDFRHDRLPLANGHKGVGCAKCHLEERNYSSVKGKRCEECHESPHRADFDRDCEVCHARDASPWRDGGRAIDAALHSRTGFALSRPHDVSCEKCHEGPSFAERYSSPRRSSCTACHADVHKGQFAGRACLECHSADRWKPARVDHGLFPLRLAHEKVECNKCHEGGGFRGTPRACALCHEDRHKGQFGKSSCDSCHTEKAFLPSLFDVARHKTFALTGAHAAVACNGCHANGRFKDTPRSCKECHDDVHNGQFGAGKDCSACHLADSSTFAIRPFDHAKRTGYELVGAHAEAKCARCHVERKGVRVFRDTPKACASCHTDVHRGQFKDTRCDRCHVSRADWTAGGFDHGRTRFPLDRAHAAVACDRCHAAVPQLDGAKVIQFRPLSTECQSCHAIQR